jgi:hypothetical protein
VRQTETVEPLSRGAAVSGADYFDPPKPFKFRDRSKDRCATDAARDVSARRGQIAECWRRDALLKARRSRL